MGKPSKQFLTGVVQAFYDMPNNICGGHLHIVLDDNNLERDHIQWCREEALKAGDADAVWLADLLLQFDTCEELWHALNTHGMTEFCPWKGNENTEE